MGGRSIQDRRHCPRVRPPAMLTAVAGRLFAKSPYEPHFPFLIT